MNLVGAAAEALGMAGGAEKGASGGGAGGGAPPVEAPPAASQSGVSSTLAAEWDERQQLSLVEALKR